MERRMVTEALLSKLMVNHLHDKFKKLKKILNLKKYSNILDIGSSDSTFLNFFLMKRRVTVV